MKAYSFIASLSISWNPCGRNKHVSIKFVYRKYYLICRLVCFISWWFVRVRLIQKMALYFRSPQFNLYCLRNILIKANLFASFLIGQKLGFLSCRDKYTYMNIWNWCGSQEYPIELKCVVTPTLCKDDCSFLWCPSVALLLQPPTSVTEETSGWLRQNVSVCDLEKHVQQSIKWTKKTVFIVRWDWAFVRYLVKSLLVVLCRDGMEEWGLAVA